jgi:hypothetical protein
VAPPDETPAPHVIGGDEPAVDQRDRCGTEEGTGQREPGQ